MLQTMNHISRKACKSYARCIIYIHLDHESYESYSSYETYTP